MSEKVFLFQDSSRISELVELFSTGLGETTYEYWKWRLFSDIGEMNPTAVVFENENGRLDGMLTAIPVIYGDEQNRKRALQMCDWVVRPEARGKGILSKMYRYITEIYRDMGFDFLMAFCPNENSRPVFERYQYQNYGIFSRWSTKFHLIFGASKTGVFQGKNAEYRFTENCPDIEFSPNKLRLLRDRFYMEWKFDKDPSVSYSWLSVWKEQKCIGYFVYVFTKGRIRTVVNVYDWEFEKTEPTAFSEAVSLLNTMGNSVCIWGRYSEAENSLFKSAELKEKNMGCQLVVKPFDETKKIPDGLIFSRVDMDY